MVLDQFTSRSLGSHDNASCRIDRWSLGLSLEILHGSRITRDCRMKAPGLSRFPRDKPVIPVLLSIAGTALPLYLLYVFVGALFAPPQPSPPGGRGLRHFLPPRTCLCRWRRFPTPPFNGILDLSLVCPAPPQ